MPTGKVCMFFSSSTLIVSKTFIQEYKIRVFRIIWVQTVCQQTTLVGRELNGIYHKNQHFRYFENAQNGNRAITYILTIHMHAFVVICRHLSKLTFSQKSFRNTNRLDTDQEKCSVGPDLGQFGTIISR